MVLRQTLQPGGYCQQARHAHPVKYDSSSDEIKLSLAESNTHHQLRLYNVRSPVQCLNHTVKRNNCSLKYFKITLETRKKHTHAHTHTLARTHIRKDTSEGLPRSPNQMPGVMVMLSASLHCYNQTRTQVGRSSERPRPPGKEQKQLPHKPFSNTYVLTITSFSTD